MFLLNKTIHSFSDIEIVKWSHEFTRQVYKIKTLIYFTYFMTLCQIFYISPILKNFVCTIGLEDLQIRDLCPSVEKVNFF